jgi:virginiamycin B lyase
MMLRAMFTAVAAIVAVQSAHAAEVRYYELPAGGRAHDVAPALDGGVWYTAQSKGFLGHYDPKTGKHQEVSLGKGSSPHGVVVASDGGAWVTDSGLNAMVRVDPATKAVKVFALPKDTAYTNLNTPTIGKDGTVWFTGQSGYHGRVDPKSGKVDVWKSPRANGPYGITTTPAGDIWYASLAGDYIGKVASDGSVTVVDPPKQRSGPRRVWSDSKGMIWASFWHSGEVARYDPAAKSWKTWRLPKSGSGTYSVYVDDKDRVWLTDFVANAIVRFDPTTEKFESFPSNKPNAAVRQMLGRPGEAWGAESGTDRLVLVKD